jgi:hypothetical protein
MHLYVVFEFQCSSLAVGRLRTRLARVDNGNWKRFTCWVTGSCGASEPSGYGARKMTGFGK